MMEPPTELTTDSVIFAPLNFDGFESQKENRMYRKGGGKIPEIIVMNLESPPDDWMKKMLENKETTLTEVFNNLYNTWNEPKQWAYCKKCDKYPDILFSTVDSPIYGEDGETVVNSEDVIVQLNNNGICNNLYFDGVAGVPKEIQDLANEDESPVCCECYEEIEWIHTNKYSYHDWFERDESLIELREKGTEKTIIEFRNEELSEAVESGEIDPRNFELSLRKVAKERGLI